MAILSSLFERRSKVDTQTVADEASKEPSILYKYMGDDKLRFIHPVLSLGFPKYDLLNDPFETSISNVISGLRDEAKALMEVKKAARTRIFPLGRTFDIWQQQYYEHGAFEADLSDIRRSNQSLHVGYESAISSLQELRLTSGILSLTTNPLSNLMWAHYANNHRGICIGLNATDDFFSSNNSPDKSRTVSSIKKVVYSNIRPQFGREFFSSNDLWKVFCLKHTDWSYETEYRVIRHRNSEAPVHVEYPSMELVKELYLGLKCAAPIDLIERMRRSCVRIFKIVLPEHGFNLVAEELLK
jgi:hypothetical protein